MPIGEHGSPVPMRIEDLRKRWPRFVATTTEGGPFDTSAYLAGYEAGMIESVLGLMAPTHLKHSIDERNLEQIDLVAMRHDYLVESSDPDPECHGNVVVVLHKIEK